MKDVQISLRVQLQPAERANNPDLREKTTQHFPHPYQERIGSFGPIVATGEEVAWTT